eukprot:GHVP01056650.1.p1 GENE.GHVP01056650.1~~GHVP01056650.1.p1  ORF type:complete len:484 (+),score=127.27 GHVP01056650.1:379-1830(+)
MFLEKIRGNFMLFVYIFPKILRCNYLQPFYGGYPYDYYQTNGVDPRNTKVCRLMKKRKDSRKYYNNIQKEINKNIDKKLKDFDTRVIDKASKYISSALNSVTDSKIHNKETTFTEDQPDDRINQIDCKVDGKKEENLEEILKLLKNITNKEDTPESIPVKKDKIDSKLTNNIEKQLHKLQEATEEMRKCKKTKLIDKKAILKKDELSKKLQKNQRKKKRARRKIRELKKKDTPESKKKIKRAKRKLRKLKDKQVVLSKNLEDIRKKILDKSIESGDLPDPTDEEEELERLHVELEEEQEKERIEKKLAEKKKWKKKKRKYREKQRKIKEQLEKELEAKNRELEYVAEESRGQIVEPELIEDAIDTLDRRIEDVKTGLMDQIKKEMKKMDRKKNRLEDKIDEIEKPSPSLSSHKNEEAPKKENKKKEDSKQPRRRYVFPWDSDTTKRLKSKSGPLNPFEEIERSIKAGKTPEFKRRSCKCKIPT